MEQDCPNCKWKYNRFDEGQCAGCIRSIGIEDNFELEHSLKTIAWDGVIIDD